MSAEQIDVLAVNALNALDRIAAGYLPSSEGRKRVDAIRAAVAELIERERQQRETLEALCGAYIANRGSIGQIDFVRCVAPGGRLADTELGRLWLKAHALARAQAAPEPTHADKLHDGARLHLAQGYDIETAKRMARDAIRAGAEDH